MKNLFIATLAVTVLSFGFSPSGMSLGMVQAGEVEAVPAEVRRVNTRANTLSLRHEAIPHLDMPPMTMTFRVSDPQILENLSPGDQIRVHIEKVDGEYTIISIE